MIKNKKMVIGIAAMGLGFIAREIRQKKKIKELDFKINSMNKSMGVLADAHNSFVKKTTKEINEMDSTLGCLVDDLEIYEGKIMEPSLDLEEDDFIKERLNRIEDEIGSVYEHIEKLAIDRN